MQEQSTRVVTISLPRLLLLDTGARTLVHILRVGRILSEGESYPKCPLVGCCLATKSLNLNITKWNGWS